jgi:hypothetical protein
MVVLVEDAGAVLEGILGGVLPDLTSARKEHLIDVFAQFQGVEFSISTGPEADGMLFEYGAPSFTESPSFTLQLTRQLETVDARGEHESYVQAQLAAEYELTERLASLGHNTIWWFRTNGPFEAWITKVEGDPVWGAIGDLRPFRLEVFHDVI